MIKKKTKPLKVVNVKLIKIQSKEAYELTMKEINALMEKGEKTFALQN